MHIKRNPELEKIAFGARMAPSQAPVSGSEYCHVRKHAVLYREVAGDNFSLLPLLKAHLSECTAVFPAPVLESVKEELLQDFRLSPAAWRYVCRYGAALFAPIWEVTRESDAWRAAGFYLRALHQAGLPPPPPRVLALGWLRMFATPGTDLFRMDYSLARIPAAITRCVLIEAARHRNGLLEAKVVELLRALTWGDDVRLHPCKTQRRGGWAWVNRMAAQWEAAMPDTIENPDHAWRVRIDSFRYQGYTVQALRTPRELVRHAQLMRNCLDTEVSHCRNGLARFYAGLLRTNVRQKRMTAADKSVSLQAPTQAMKEFVHGGNHPKLDCWPAWPVRQACRVGPSA